MLECNRNGRPIPSRDNINQVIEMNQFTFNKTSEYGVTMFVNGVATAGSEDAVRVIWERCVALDFLNTGLLRASANAYWWKVNEVKGYSQKETARTNGQSGS
ncbi:hypothetical protein KW419_10535 [Vibrio fluvialis]|nr:hypothetical protein [Vibrio fluvialis]MBY7954365.1 hypothetical protein [Vibrio fluvialis]